MTNLAPNKLLQELDELFEKVKAQSLIFPRLKKTDWNKVKQAVSTPVILGFNTGMVKTQEEHDRMFKMAEELAHIEILLALNDKWR